ncbi:MAG: AbrB/MazE/SpoVT family DNA-binding domain-containing protein [Thaumarchaeota archaeon]|nr:AbrB/MazE/SpoVT family DNA-binding domain-containing protein [Nitrososphaerota archaeon]
MSVVEVDPRFRVTIPKEIRAKLRVTEGQKLYVVSFGDSFIMKPVPDDPAHRLDEVLGDFSFDKEARRKAEKWLFENPRRRR